MYDTEPLSFKDWILKFIEVDLPIGDLARDVLRTSDFPGDNNFTDIHEHFYTKSHYDPEIMKLFIAVWNFYSVSQ